MKKLKLPGIKKPKIFSKISEKHRKRIKKILFCAAAVCITAVPAVFVNTAYGYLPVLVILSAMAASWVYLQILKRTWTYEEISDFTNCSRGTQVEFSVKVANRFLLVYPKVELFFYISDLFGETDTITESVITLAPKEKRQFDFGVRFDHIGTYSAGLKKIRIHDLLGLFSCEVGNLKEYKVNVSPKIFDVADLYISDSTMTESQKMVVPAVIDGADYAGVREYVWGDPIKNIHWKLSARTEVYMTKQFESYGVPGVDVILDFTAPAEDSEVLMSLFDGVVETALSVAEYTMDQGMDCELLYMNRKGIKTRIQLGTDRDYMDMIQDMPAISVKKEGTTGIDLLREECNSLYSQGNIAFCTADVTEELGDLMIQIKNRRKNPMLFVILPEHITGDERTGRLKPLGMLGQAGIQYHVLSSAGELGGGEKK